MDSPTLMLYLTTLWEKQKKYLFQKAQLNKHLSSAFYLQKKRL